MVTNKRRVYAFLVHLFTASGAGIALFAMLAAGEGDWKAMYFWLILAFIVDGIDGPLARHFEVKKYAAEWDGVLLDLIIDYLTYVFIPAYALAKSGILPEWEGWLAAIYITLTGAMYFADTRMKTADNSFSGFPGAWNMVVFVFFALHPSVPTMLVVTFILGIVQFFPIHFLHPVRTKRWRNFSLPITLIWIGAAAYIGYHDFQDAPRAELILTITSIYLLAVGALQQLIKPRLST